MPNLLEAGKFLADYGVVAFIIVGFGLLGLYLSVRFFLSLHRDIQDVTIITKQLGEKIVTDKGNPIIHYDLMRNIENELQELRQDSEAHISQAGKHYDEVIRLNSQEAYVHCNIDKCPHLITVITNIKNVGALFEQFNIKAEESRNSTGASLKDIQSQMQVLATEVSAQSKQVVQLLGDVLVGRKTK
jgi:ElaB/YqjD/DUF883 family membrane-anchored ribosome-binding protein